MGVPWLDYRERCGFLSNRMVAMEAYFALHEQDGLPGDINAVTVQLAQ